MKASPLESVPASPISDGEVGLSREIFKKNGLPEL